jgi:LacI family transcriptional regulator
MSIKDIRRITGYSYSTISRVLNGKAKEFRISDETCKKILFAAKEVNYRPNILARSLRLQKTMSIGLIVSDIQNPFFGELSSKVEVRFRERGYSTILCNTNEIPENEEFYLQVLMDRKVDGILIAPTRSEEWQYLEEIRKERSVVLIDRIFENSELPWVTSDNRNAAENLTSRLIESGCKKIAYLGGIPDTYINKVRFMGFRDAFKKHSIEMPEDRIIFKDYSSQAGEEMMEKLLNKCPDVDAVFCVNNLVFFGAIKTVQMYESRKGVSIMMAAFDIGHYCSMFKRPLLCANQDIDALAESAVNLLLDQIEGKNPQNHQIMIPIRMNDFRIG